MDACYIGSFHRRMEHIKGAVHFPRNNFTHLAVKLPSDVVNKPRAK